jgi:hypothetical protein
MKLTVVVFAVVLLGTLAFAGSPIAAVMGTATYEVNGVAIPTRGGVPVSIGDEVVTQSGTATLKFRDGTGIVLHANTRAKLAGDDAAPTVRILRGMATYSLAPNTKVRVEDDSGSPVTRILTNSAAAVRSVNDAASPVVYRSNAVRSPGLSGVVMPSTAVLSGQFVRAGDAGAGTGSTYVILPNGTRIMVQQQGSHYVITSVQVPVNVPGQSTPTYITADSSVLTGATITGIDSSTTGGVVQIGIVPAGSSTPLSPTQIASAIQTSATTAVNTAIQQGQLPSGSTSGATSTPVTTGQFSSSAP